MPGRPSPFEGYDAPRAWEVGTNDWAEYVPLVILFGLPTLIAAVVIAMILAELAKRLLVPKGGPTV
jgi:hypothetical protein